MAKINNEFILPKQADSQLSENVYFIDIQPVGYLLSVNEVKFFKILCTMSHSKYGNYQLILNLKLR